MEEPPVTPPVPTPPVSPAAPEEIDETKTPATATGLRVHVLSTRNTYVAMKFDVLSVETKQLAASGVGAMESRGEAAPFFELPPGTYKIVRAGEPFETKVDYAVVTVVDGVSMDYLIVVDPDTNAFRASGPVLGELPRGRDIAGFRVSLNGGGNFLFNQKRKSIGTTNGTTTVFGLFGNFGLVVDRGTHFVDVAADMNLDLVDPVTGSLTPTNDLFQASALYSYKINNPYLGPYVRGSMRTRIFPGYLYLESDDPTTTVSIERLDGTSESMTVGAQANPDDLRIKIAKPFAPLKLQEELGANVKAVDLDLLLVKLHVATRLGFGFRQGFTNGLLVAQNSESASTVRLREVDDYSTLGPVAGANASVTLARWLFGSAQLGLLAPVMNTDKSTSDEFGGRLLVDFSGSAGFKVPILTNLLYASADYTFRLERDAFLTNSTQFEHALMARASVTLF